MVGSQGEEVKSSCSTMHTSCEHTHQIVASNLSVTAFRNDAKVDVCNYILTCLSRVI